MSLTPFRSDGALRERAKLGSNGMSDTSNPQTRRVLSVLLGVAAALAVIAAGIGYYKHGWRDLGSDHDLMAASFFLFFALILRFRRFLKNKSAAA